MQTIFMHENMKHKISSSSTFFHKVFVPTFWIIMFGFATLALWFGHFDRSSQPPETEQYSFLVVWIIGSALLLRDTVRLKTISLDNDNLVVKDFKKVIRVPLRNVNHISETRLSNPKKITLTVYPPCEFGNKITFIPTISLKTYFLLWEEHPIASRLRQMTGALK